MRNLYENLLELDNNNEYQIFYDFEISENSIFSDDIYINMKYLKEKDFNEDYRIFIRNENIYIELLEKEDDDKIYRYELFSMNYIQFENDNEDIHISFIIYSFLLNRYNYMKKYYEELINY